MHSFTIKDLENLSGIKAHTIRIWEHRYSFLKPERSETNIRHYNNEELKKLLNVALLNKYGFKISHIDKMDEIEINQKILSLNQGQAHQERILNELIRHMINLDIEKFELLLDDYIIARGTEKAIIQIIFPFLEKIGILWLTNHINPAQEHIITNIIRQKLIFSLENLGKIVEINKTILLFLPEGEYHELGLLFMHYLLKNRGAKIIYMGCNVPLADIEYVVNIKKPDYLFAHLTSRSHKFNFDKFMSSISKNFQGTPVILSGQLVKDHRKKVHAPIFFKKNFSEVMEFVLEL